MCQELVWNGPLKLKLPSCRILTSPTNAGELPRRRIYKQVKESNDYETKGKSKLYERDEYARFYKKKLTFNLSQKQDASSHHPQSRQWLMAMRLRANQPTATLISQINIYAYLPTRNAKTRNRLSGRIQETVWQACQCPYQKRDVVMKKIFPETNIKRERKPIPLSMYLCWHPLNLSLLRTRSTIRCTSLAIHPYQRHRRCRPHHYESALRLESHEGGASPRKPGPYRDLYISMRKREPHMRFLRSEQVGMLLTEAPLSLTTSKIKGVVVHLSKVFWISRQLVSESR